MTITFENENHIIIYAREKSISYSGNGQYIFLAQSIRRISSIISLQQGSVMSIDILKIRSDITAASTLSVTLDNQENFSTLKKDSSDSDHIASHTHLERLARLQETTSGYSTSEDESVSTSEDNTHDKILQNNEESLEQSGKLLGVFLYQ